MSELLEKCKNEPLYNEYLKKYENTIIKSESIQSDNNIIIPLNNGITLAKKNNKKP